MEKLRSLRIYKILLDVTWYGIIVFLSLYFVGNIFYLIGNSEFELINFDAFPLKFEIAQFDFKLFKNAYLFVQDDHASVIVKLSKVKASSLRDPFVMWYVCTFLITIAVLLYQLKLFRLFIGDVIEKKIFTKLNVRRLQLIGFIQLATIPIGIVTYLIFTYFFINHSIIDSRLKFSPDYWQLFEELMPGLEYLIFAGVFGFGLKLKQEQDLTI